VAHRLLHQTYAPKGLSLKIYLSVDSVTSAITVKDNESDRDTIIGKIYSQLIV